jgi:tetratricopeptide (TPR) repeat protein
MDGNPKDTVDDLLARGERAERDGDLAEAERLYRQADEAGSAEGAACLGVLLFERGDVDGAHEVLTRSDERGSGLGSFRLGFLLQHVRKYDAAERAYRRAVERGNANAAGNLASLARFRESRDDRDPAALLDAGARFAAAGDAVRAERAYYATIDTAHPDHAPNAWFNLGALHQQHGDVGAALAAYRTIIALGHDEFGPRALVTSGSSCSTTGATPSAPRRRSGPRSRPTTPCRPPWHGATSRRCGRSSRHPARSSPRTTT